MLSKIKKTILIIISCGLALLILLCAAYAFFVNVPIDRTPVDISLTVTKLDEKGQHIDIFPVTINGHVEKYLYQDDRLNVHIDPFDGYVDFHPHNLNNVDGGIFDFPGLRMTRYYATGSDGFEYFTIYFSEDHSRWAFVVEDYMFNINGRYVASTNPDSISKDLMDYFGAFLRTE